MMHKTWKTNHSWCFLDVQFTAEPFYEEFLAWKIYFRYLLIFKQQILLRMVFIYKI